MDAPLDIRRAVESEIRAAFQGVTLGQGISLRQAQCADVFGQALLKGAPASSAPEEINDWSRVSIDELESDYIAHLDAGGFRYYIPALMLSVLNRYEPTSMRVIGTLSGLYPKKESLGMCDASVFSSHPCAEDSHRTIPCAAS